jgi:hypothetical protein
VDVHQVVEKSGYIAGALDGWQSIIRKKGVDLIDAVEGEQFGDGGSNGFGRDVLLEGDLGDSIFEGNPSGGKSRGVGGFESGADFSQKN